MHDYTENSGTVYEPQDSSLSEARREERSVASKQTVVKITRKT